MPKFKNPLAAAAALADRLSNPEATPVKRRNPAHRLEREAEDTAPITHAEEEIAAAPTPPESPAPHPVPPAKAAEPPVVDSRPYVLREIIIPVAEEQPAPSPKAEITFSSFTEEENENADGSAPIPHEGGFAAPAASIPEGPIEPDEAPAPGSGVLPKLRRPRAVVPVGDLGSTVWALSILLGVVCTIVAFVVGAMA